jgi:DNA transformation protein
MPAKPRQSRIKPVKIGRDIERRSRGSALNLGPKSMTWLRACGITTLEQVRQLGPIEICRRLHANGFNVSAVMAYALEGALSGTHWNAIPSETKAWLRAEFVRLTRTED